MNNKKVITELESMKGKTFQYANKIHFILDLKIDELKEKCQIKTNLSVFDRPFEAIEEFLKFWRPVDSAVALQPLDGDNSSMAIIIEQENALTNNLIDTLNDNIRKVQADKGYIPQAVAINNNVNSIVNIAKMRIDFMRLVKSSKHA